MNTGIAVVRVAAYNSRSVYTNRILLDCAYTRRSNLTVVVKAWGVRHVCTSGHDDRRTEFAM